MPQQAKQAIRQSFIKLLNEKPFDKISVKDIVEDCNINRNTFYYHYQDIFALVEDILRIESEKNLKKDISFISWQEDFIQAMDFALQNKRLILHLKNSRHKDELNRYFFKIADDLMYRFVKHQAEGMEVSERDIKLIANFYTHGVVGIIYGWLSDNMSYDPESMIRRTGQLLDGNIGISLKRAESNAEFQK